VVERDLVASVDRLGTVSDVLVPIHCVATTAPFDEVLDEMATNRWDAVVVTEDGRVDGIFTSSDAVRVLRDVLRRRRARA
jgi:CBS domain-containing protein